MTDVSVFDREAQVAYNREHAARVVGKAVHPGALDRLFELYPDVKIDVRHEIESFPDRRNGWRPDDERTQERQTTLVVFWLTGDRGTTARYVWGQSQCHPNDNWDRCAGIKLAFDRALETARKCYRRERWEAAQLDQGRQQFKRTPISKTAF